MDFQSEGLKRASYAVSVHRRDAKGAKVKKEMKDDEFIIKTKPRSYGLMSNPEEPWWVNGLLWVIAIVIVSIVLSIVFILLNQKCKTVQADPYSWAMAEENPKPEIRNPKSEKDFPVELKILSGEGRITINLKTGIVEYYNTTLDESSLAFWNYVMDAFPWVKRQIIREHMAAREKAIERTR